MDKGRFNMKVRRFIEAHSSHIAIQKLRKAEQLTNVDIQELEKMLVEEGIADPERIEELKEKIGLGRFLRSLTGLDRQAAKSAFSELISRIKLNSNQMEFIDLIINSLCETGFVEPKRFYESPFTDLDDRGIAGLFDISEAKLIMEIVRDLNDSAAA